MNAGTKVFLAVVALLVGVMILYYGVFQTGDHPTPARGSTGPEAPAVRPPSPPPSEEGHLIQPVLRNDPKPGGSGAGNATTFIPPATDPLADFGAMPDRGTRGLLTDSISGASSNTPTAPTGTPALSGNAPSDKKATATPEIRPNTPTPKPTAGQPTEGVEYTTYTVKDRDTGVSIAQEWFGDGNKWALISKANPMVDFNRLKIGQTLRLPPKDAAKETVKPTTTVSKPAESAGDPNIYVVKSGDTLNSIARAKYGDALLWELIYDANKKTIGDDPGALKIGMKLTIPAKPATSSSSR